MTKPVTIPNTFATATTAIPLSNLDADFSTVATALNDANTYSNYAPDTGSANAYVVTLSGVSTTYSAGLRIQFKAGNANTTASTLNVNGGGAKNITYQDATAIASGTIAANSIVDVMYDGTQFLLMNDPAGATGGDVVGPSSATDNAIVRFDGTTGKLVQNSVVTIADSTGDISGVGQLNATTLDATNIEVTNIKAKDGTAAASIADSTGVISITSNPVLSGGTANGVLYLNGSKVATSGSALTFDGTNFLIGVASLTPPSVGTTAPWANVSNGNNGALLLGPANTGTAFWHDNGGDTVTTIRSLYASTSANAQLRLQAGFLTFHAGTALSEQMRLTSTGLGIGTSSPSVKLQVSGSIAAGAISTRVTNTDATGMSTVEFSDGTNTKGQIWAGNGSYASFGGAGSLNYSANSGPHVWYTNYITGGERMRLDSSGNLGLGVSPSAWSPYKAFQFGKEGVIFGDAGGGTAAFGSNLYYNAGFKYIATDAASYYSQASGVHAWYNAASGTAGDPITFSQAMTLNANGNLLVGTTTAAYATAGRGLVEVNGSSTALIAVKTSDTARGYFAASTSITELAAVGASQPLVFTTNSSERARITSGGLVQVSSGGSVQIGDTAARATTAGTNRLDIFNGTAPVGTLSNGISIYSSSGEAYVMDAAGNATLFSPHDAETNEWIFKSKHTPTGKTLKIDVEKLLRFINDHFGLDAVHEFIEP